jgi:hypothetical protein
MPVDEWLARMWGIDVDRLLSYLADPGAYHEPVDTEDVMP